mmetsp:Transcript_136626/g.237534  ORF Transcript_136626/g.237534 Transcript_136626/m.237534 type:complete len:544 (-) Transcript_136626:63-1694(-)
MPKADKAAKDVAEEPAPDAPKDPPAGGLDMPAPTLLPLEAETFPGESQLTEDERNRWLILHFALPRTIVTEDKEEGRTTEQELNNMLAQMAWGTVDRATSEFVLESEDPTLDTPHDSWISYAEYVDRTYPNDNNMEDDARAENVRMAAEKKNTCTNPGEPVVKFRPMFDQVVKNLVHSNKALAKAYDIKRVVLDEREIDEDPAKDDQHNILRYGRYQVLPAFWSLLIHLTKARRRFSIVFRTFNSDQLPTVQRELRLFAEGRHPAYSGQNKTQKPPPMNGEKNSRDMRLLDENVGSIGRFSGRCEFAARSAVKQVEAPPAPPPEGAEGAPAEEVPLPAFQPTIYEFPPFHKAYAGLMHHILDGANTAAIVDDYNYWKTKDQAADAGKLLLVDHGGGIAETKVQHIFFDGHIKQGNLHCVDVRDAERGNTLPFEAVDGMFTHRVDFFQACLDSEYFIKALEGCERKMSMKILESRRAHDEAAAEADKPQALDKLPPKEYLYRTVIPALLPALEACQRDRPADPIEFIAFYMLRHPKQYSKTLKA